MKPGERTATVTAASTRREQPQAQQFRLRVLEGPATGKEWSSDGMRCSIGSHASNDMVVDDRTVSRFHAEVLLDNAGAWLRDLGSHNATYLDNTSVREAMLSDGSLVRMGETLLRFEWAGAVVDVPVSASEEFGGLKGRSVAMRAVFAVLERSARSDVTILITGETGTGKDMAAESIHLASPRAAAPFVVVDCSAIQPALVESELFGHEKGAFTGALVQHQGAFERADRGTVFLDEVAELPVDLQPKLLRVLEQHEVQRVGGIERLRVDVRVIAATNRDLRARLNEGAFRPDLFYRLAVVQVRMPALRERLDDVPLLATQILRKLDPTPDVLRSLLSEDFFARLRRASWPGNIRELRNHIEQCVVLERPVPLDAPGTTKKVDPKGFDATPDYNTARRHVLDRFEREYLRWALDRHGGDTVAVAQAAGLTRRYVYQLLRRHGV